jgi:hydrogenase-4 component F
LVVLPDYKVTSWLNVAASFLTFLAALLLFGDRPEPTQFLFVDDFNIVFIVLNTFVGFTTSAFSATYIGHELETGRLTPVYLRFYHAMYQVLMFGMNLALVANNIGLMWVAIEVATLTTVLMVGIYRTHQALEAAWKYFILGSVGIALALFGTILVYMAARPAVGDGMDGMVWTLVRMPHSTRPAQRRSVFLLLGYGPKSDWRCTRGFRRHAGPTPISAVLSGLLPPSRSAPLHSNCFWRRTSRRSPVDDGDDGLISDLCGVHVATATSNACSPIRRSSTWASSPSPSAWAGRSPTSPGCCT